MSKLTHRLASAFAFAAVLFTIGKARADNNRFTADSYAAGDALVACWDGVFNATNSDGVLVHDGAATTWRDTIGGLEFQLNGALNFGDNNYLEFNANAADYGFIPLDAVGFANAFFAGEKTVEVVAEVANGIHVALQCGNGSNIAFSWYSGYAYIVSAGVGCNVFNPGWISSLTTYTTVYDQANKTSAFYYNTTAKSGSGTDHWGAATQGAWLGRLENGTRPYKGKVCVIRIYNRNLTTAEIAYNKLVDDFRYRGVEPTDKAWFEVVGTPDDFNTPNGDIQYGSFAVEPGDVLSVPAETFAFNNGTRTCLGYELYKLVNGTFQKIADETGLSYTVTAADMGGSFKLVWKWESEYTFTANSYAGQDALVAEWDAFDNQATGEYDPTARTWVDLVSGLTWQLNGDVAFTEERDPCLYFPKSDLKNYGFIPIDTPNLAEAFPDGEKTLEAAAAIGNGKVCVLGGLNLLLIDYDGWGTLFGGGKIGKTVDTSDHTFTAHYDANGAPANNYIDCTLNNANGTCGFAAPQQGVWLGRIENQNDTGGYPFNGKIRNIRIYNRQLTAAEMEYNKRVDDIRYRGASAEDMEMRINANGEFEYPLKVAVDPAGTYPGKIKVGSNAPVDAGTFWYTNNAPVTVTFIPDDAGGYRYLEGPVAESERPTINSVVITMPDHVQTVTAINYPYDDGVIVTADPTLVKTTTFGGLHHVYAFTNVSLLTYHVYSLQNVTFEEALVVGGGGSGDALQGGRGMGAGGGGGGVLWTGTRHLLPSGSDVKLAVGAGGYHKDWDTAGYNGGDSTIFDGTISLTALGGGGAGKNGGSGGGWGYKGTDGQGFDGGTAPSVSPWPAGSGGGAEERGGNTTMEGSGDTLVITHGKGGDGRWDSITGVAHCYGSGGGSGSNRKQDIRGEGGAESGGAGCYVDANGVFVKGECGVDGLGGGGGVHGNSMIDGFGLGGCGTVIISLSLGDKMARQFSFDDFKTYPIKDGAATPKPAISVGGVELTEGEDYDLTYERNDVAGRTAYMIVTGKGDYDDIALRHPFKPSTVVFVKRDGLPENGGTSWADAQDLVTAIGRLADGPLDIWCEAGEYAVTETLSIASKVDLIGGFAADPDDVAKKAANGAKTVLVGDGTLAALLTTTLAAPTKYDTISITDFTFIGATGGALTRATDMGFTVTDCDFFANVSALKLAGGANYPIAVSGCRFEGNTNQVVIRSSSAATVMENCLFLTNGVPVNQIPSVRTIGNDYAVLESSGSGTFTIRNCRFIANRASVTRDQGALLHFANPVYLLMDHCQFLGNEMRRADNGNSAMIHFHTWSNTGYPLFDHCTFAYNLINGPDTTAVIRESSGSVYVRNSIFHKNKKANGFLCQDIDIATPGAGHISYTMFDSTELNACYNATDIGAGVVAGDPCLVSDDLEDMILLDGSYIYYDPAQYARVVALDAHLSSPEGYRTNGSSEWIVDEDAPYSPAIDTGDPEEDWSIEPERNGSRLNLGCYGNTAEASKTPYANPVLGIPEVTFPTQYTQPTVSVAMGGEGAFSVTVVISISTNNEDWIYAKDFALKRGETANWAVPGYLPPGSPVYVKTSFDFNGETYETTYSEYEMPSDKTLPPWAGKGGDPAKVIHLRPDAIGKGDGTSWTDAYTKIADALNAMVNDGTKEELWIAGTHTTLAGNNGKQYNFGGNRPHVMFRGGFDGHENTPEERTNEWSVIDGACVADGLYLSGKTAILDGLTFTRCYSYAAKVGACAVTNCAFVNNGWTSEFASGRGLYINTNGGKATISGCRFEGNVSHVHKENGNVGSGSALYVFNTSITMDNCLFASNGLAHAMAELGSAEPGSAMALDWAPLAATNCRFIGNRNGRFGNNGSTIYSINGGDASYYFTNCLFLANEQIYSAGNSGGTASSCFYGTCKRLELVNCTFAYNFTENASSGCVYFNRGNGATASELKIRNTIFHGNVNAAQTEKDHFDVFLSGNNSTLDVAYSCFDRPEDIVVSTIAATNIAESVLFTDPKLYSTTNDFAQCITNTEGASSYKYLNWEEKGEILQALNVHLRGRGGYIDETTGEKVSGEGKPSPCVDAGDPAMPYRNEPKPRGHRVNMGFYGNTPWATCSPPGTAVRIR